jgi:phosphoribosyl 1,2-cyclic phosphodiesterase
VLRFCCLGSGSEGNALVVEASAGLFPTRILVDNGFNLRQVSRRLQRAGLALEDIDAVVVTHEHSDHAAGVAAFARRARVPVFATAGTAQASGLDRPGRRWQPLAAGRTVGIGALEVLPYAVPHDAADPVQFVFSDGDARFGLLTDIGAATEAVAAALSGLDALMLECNHDPHLLRTGPYPALLKARIAGDRGHLSNLQAAALLESVRHDGLRFVIAAHLSRSNNRPDLARAALAAVLGCADGDVMVADQDDGLSWLSL